MTNLLDLKLEPALNQKDLRKLHNILRKVYFYAIATSTNDLPQATMVQPIVTGEWKFVFVSNSSTKKVRNLIANPNTWMIADATGLFHIPKVIYIKGRAEIEPLTEESFTDFLSFHGPLSRKILTSLAENNMENTSLVTVTPSRIITVGIFGKMDKQISFDVIEQKISV